MNSKIKIVVFVLVLIVMTFLISYFSFNEFYNKDLRLVSSLDIHIKNNTNLDENKDANVATFIISNDSNFSINYKVLINDNSNKKNGVERKYVNYKLKLGDKIIKSGKFSDLENGVLMSGAIDGRSKYIYSLELELDENADLYDKYYRCDLTIEPIM